MTTNVASNPGNRSESRVRTGLAEGFGDHPFALCLTHDVDRPYKTVQAPYKALRERNGEHLRQLVSDASPYWQFEDIMAIESAFGVRSSFYFLEEKRLHDLPPHRWLRPRNWLRFTGYYRIHDPDITAIMRELASGGWEVGIHGSFESARDPERFAAEKQAIERALGEEVVGGRQHFLNLDRPASWRMHRDRGLAYDASLGSSTEYGFLHGYDVKRPFDDDFLVFPLTIMEVALVQGAASIEAAKAEIDRLLEEAARHGAIMTVLWHVRLFNAEEFPGYQELYRYLLERASAANAWIGPIRDAHRAITAQSADRVLHSRR